MQDKDLVSIVTVENTVVWLDYLTITRPHEFLRTTTAVRVISELLDMAEDTFDKLSRSDRIFQRDVISDCIKVRQRGL